MESQKNRTYIYLLKAFAIFSVVCAHTAVEPKESSMWIDLAVRILSAIGTMGVPIFFIVSGYLYYGNQRGIKDFFCRKCKTIIVPWFFCETIVWFYVVLRKGGITFNAWLKYVLGVYHSTYYLTVLMILYILFWRIKKYECVLIGSILLSSLCVLGLGYGVPFVLEWNKLTITSYLNIFNWILYFALGMLLKKKEFLEALAIFAKKILPLSTFLLIVDFGIHCFYRLSWTYFSRYALLNIMLQILVVMGICYGLCEKRVEKLVVAGKYSYAIYLLHGLGAGGVNWITGLTGSGLFILVRPVIVILLVILGIYIVRKICNKFRILRNIPEVLIGIR